MILRIRGRQYSVRFQHWFETEKHKRVRRTLCTVEFLKDGVYTGQLAEGLGKQLPLDTDNPAEGRKHAFAKAVITYTTEKELRLLFWKAMWARRKKYAPKKFKQDRWSI